MARSTIVVFAAAAAGDARAVRWMREAQAEIQQAAEQAMAGALRGQAREAVDRLLLAGESTGNLKLIDMAVAVARRHHERIDEAERLVEQATGLARRYGAPGSHIAGIKRSHRTAGGLALRA